MDTALAYYHLIPESGYGISAASTRRTYAFNTPIAGFSYRTIKPSLFFGYDLISHGNKHMKIACMEKAILDYFYLNPGIKRGSDFAGLRINRDLFFEKAQKERLHQFTDKFAKKTLDKRIQSFIRFLKNA